MNSTDLLEVIKDMGADTGEPADIDIILLSQKTKIPVPKLLSILTELEQRDEIVLEVKTGEFENELRYSGHVRLMENPSDELE